MVKLLMIGGGGHAISSLEVIKMTGLYEVDKVLSVTKTHPSLTKLLDHSANLKDLRKYYDHAFIGVGQIKEPDNRIRIFNELKELNFELPSIISSKSYVSSESKIGEGTIIMNFSLINTHAFVGKNCIVNNFALVEHSAFIGNNVHISTGAKINGDAKIEESCFIGSGAVVGNGVTVGKNSIVSANSFVFKDIPNNTKFR